MFRFFMVIVKSKKKKSKFLHIIILSDFYKSGSSDLCNIGLLKYDKLLLNNLNLWLKLVWNLSSMLCFCHSSWSPHRLKIEGCWRCLKSEIIIYYSWRVNWLHWKWKIVQFQSKLHKLIKSMISSMMKIKL